MKTVGETSAGSTSKTCRVTFEDVNLKDKAFSISITGTWLPVTPVGGCKDFKANTPTLGLTINLSSEGFARCLIP